MAVVLISSRLPAGTSTFLKIRWWVGTGLLATPTVAVQLWHNQPPASSILPPDAVVHIVVAWAVGGLMAYLNDWYRRCVSSSQGGGCSLTAGAWVWFNNRGPANS